MTNRIVLILLALVFGSAGLNGVAAGEQFRLENRVYVGAEKEPRLVSTTLFYNQVVYDFLTAPAEVTIFDKPHGRFILLDLSRRVKTELPTERVHEFGQRLKQWGETQTDPLLKFLVDPKFEERYDDHSGEMVFSSHWLTYRLVTVETESEEISRQYGEFSDWYCQLNTLLNPGTRPPFARMVVNAALEARQRFPQEVHLTLRKDNFLSKQITVRSEHQLVRQLVQSDRDRIAQTDQFLAIFKPAAFDEYQTKMGKQPESLPRHAGPRNTRSM